MCLSRTEDMLPEHVANKEASRQALSTQFPFFLIKGTHELLQWPLDRGSRVFEV